MIFDHFWKKKAAPQKTPNCFARISEKSSEKFFLVSLVKHVYFLFHKLTFWNPKNSSPAITRGSKVPKKDQLFAGAEGARR